MAAKCQLLEAKCYIRSFMGKLLLTALTSAVLLLIPSYSHAQADNPQLTGTVAYRERIALPPDAVIDVQLLDTSVADVAAQTIAEVLINAEGRQVPVPFSLTYDPAKIDAAHRYSVRAKIRSGDGMLMFSSTQAYPVLTHGAPAKAYLILHTVGHGAKAGVTANKTAAPAATEATASNSESAPAAVPGSAAPATVPGTEAMPSAETPSAHGSDKVAQADATAPPQTAAPAASPAESASGSQPESTAVATPPQAESSGTPPPPGGSETAPSSESPSPAAAESAPPAQEPVLTAPAATEQQAPSVERPTTPAAATVETPAAANPETKPTESPAASEAASSKSNAEPNAPTPEVKAAEPEASLPEAPSASKHLEAPPASADESASGEESSSRPERLAARKADTPLADTNWRLVQLEGQDVLITPPQKPVTISFSPEGRRIGGMTGCNSYLGTFNDDHGHLDLHPGNMTMMMCGDPAGSRERKFVAMLRSADGYKINGDVLLLTSNGKTVAKFKNNP